MKNIIAMTLALLLATTYVASAADCDPKENTTPAEPAATTGQYTIQEIISKLEGELAKGTAVYTPCELERIKSKLEEEQRTFEVMMANS